MCETTELKSSVSLDAARRAVSEVKAHTKAKAAALLQASSAGWADKLSAAKADRAALQAQLEHLQEQHQQVRLHLHLYVCLIMKDYGYQKERLQTQCLALNVCILEAVRSARLAQAQHRHTCAVAFVCCRCLLTASTTTQLCLTCGCSWRLRSSAASNWSSSWQA